MDRTPQGMGAALRMLADDIENERIPMPYDIGANVFWLVAENGSLGERVTVADARLAMDLTPGGWSKNYSDAYANYTKNYGSGVAIDLALERSQVCRKVETGTRIIAATEAHEVPVYEWVCDDGLSEDTADYYPSSYTEGV
jgi:hypothetical protein